jgi:2-(3-amino-3-carboxypropyl)histidine synthase
MNICNYEIDLEKVVKDINKGNYKLVAVQIPEGLKTCGLKIVDYLQKATKADVILNIDPCFGACDIPYNNLKELGVDLIVHIGHFSIPSVAIESSIPIVFAEAKSDLKIKKTIEASIPFLVGSRVGIVTTAQHIHILDKVAEVIENNGFKPVIGKGDRRIGEKGLVLGCNFSVATSIANEVDCFLFVGSGNFHPLGLLFATNKPVIAADPYTNKVRIDEIKDLKDLILKQRYGAIAMCRYAKRFGIIVGLKPGQQRLELAKDIKRKIENAGKEAYLLSMNEFSPSKILGLEKIDCFVSTACPRIAIDDYLKYKFPILTPIELDILLGNKKWSDYSFDQILEP